MPYTLEQDTFILGAHFRSGSLGTDGIWTYDITDCIEQYQEAFPDAEFDHHNFVTHKQDLVRRFENKYCICKGKSTGRPKLLTEEVLDEVKDRIKDSPKITLRKLSTQTGLSLGSIQKAVKNINNTVNRKTPAKRNKTQR